MFDFKFKVAATYMRHFVGSEFSRSLVHKENFALKWRVVFKLEYLFAKKGWMPLLSLNDLTEKVASNIYSQ